jgi:hypothetical protein
LTPYGQAIPIGANANGINEGSSIGGTPSPFGTTGAATNPVTPTVATTSPVALVAPTPAPVAAQPERSVNYEPDPTPTKKASSKKTGYEIAGYEVADCGVLGMSGMAGVALGSWNLLLLVLPILVGSVRCKRRS